MVLLSDNTILHFQMNSADFKVAILVFLNYLSLIYLITIYDVTQKWGRVNKVEIFSKTKLTDFGLQLT